MKLQAYKKHCFDFVVNHIGVRQLQAYNKHLHERGDYKDFNKCYTWSVLRIYTRHGLTWEQKQAMNAKDCHLETLGRAVLRAVEKAYNIKLLEG